MADSVTLRQVVYDYLIDTDWGALTPPAIVWPNRGSAATFPRIEVAQGPAADEVLTLGGAYEHRGQVLLSVVADDGDGEAATGPIIRALTARFPVYLWIGEVQITKPLDVRPPLGEAISSIDPSEYRVPAYLHYRAYL